VCAERMQRIILAIILGINMGLAAEQPALGFLVQLVVIILLLIGGATGFCPMLRILGQILPPCGQINKR